jgi:mannose-6-phosphate isomerase-like protein (cupin superfamily)
VDLHGTVFDSGLITFLEGGLGVWKVVLGDRPEFLAGDDTRLREIIHPAKHPLELGYSLAHGSLSPGQRSKRHILRSSEVYYFISGQGRLTINDQVALIEAGTTVYVQPGAEQYLENTGTADMEFLCLVDPAWRQEDETVLE